jgi:hypothetical protein
VKKTRQNKQLKPGFDFLKAALGRPAADSPLSAAGFVFDGARKSFRRSGQ